MINYYDVPKESPAERFSGSLCAGVAREVVRGLCRVVRRLVRCDSLIGDSFEKKTMVIDKVINKLTHRPFFIANRMTWITVPNPLHPYLINGAQGAQPLGREFSQPEVTGSYRKSWERSCHWKWSGTSFLKLSNSLTSPKDRNHSPFRFGDRPFHGSTLNVHVLVNF